MCVFLLRSWCKTSADVQFLLGVQCICWPLSLEKISSIWNSNVTIGIQKTHLGIGLKNSLARWTAMGFEQVVSSLALIDTDVARGIRTSVFWPLYIIRYMKAYSCREPLLCKPRYACSIFFFNRKVKWLCEHMETRKYYGFELVNCACLGREWIPRLSLLVILESYEGNTLRELKNNK